MFEFGRRSFVPSFEMFLSNSSERTFHKMSQISTFFQFLANNTFSREIFPNLERKKRIIVSFRPFISLLIHLFDKEHRTMVTKIHVTQDYIFWDNIDQEI